MTVHGPLILASTSKYRHELLRRLDVDFEALAPDVDERAWDTVFSTSSDSAFALNLARAKADAVRRRRPEAFVLAADQIAVVGEPRRLLHKPETAGVAIDQLMALRGRAHRLTTGVVLVAPDGQRYEAVDHQQMTMRAFDREEAAAYVRAYAPLDCVGAYRIEDAGIKLFDAIEGADFTGIIGLPLLAVSRLLRASGLL